MALEGKSSFVATVQQTIRKRGVGGEPAGLHLLRFTNERTTA
jgi:hypothetical protein